MNDRELYSHTTEGQPEKRMTMIISGALQSEAVNWEEVKKKNWSGKK